MKTEVQNYLIAWAKDKTVEQQRALAMGLESSKEKGEDITLEVVKEWVKIAEEY